MTPRTAAVRLSVLLCVVAAAPAMVGLAQAQKGGSDWAAAFTATPAELSTVGENPYFILAPGYQLVLEGKESGKPVRLVITVLDETKKIGDFEARIVEERETQDGALVEVSRNYFAIHKTTHDVFYFGEDVDMYKNGKVVGHEGAWLHGKAGATFGMMLPGAPKAGMRYYQERAPKIAMDRAEIQKLDERQKTAAGAFERCLKVEETTPLEPGDKGLKVYAPGVGLIKDGVLELVSYRKK